VDGVTAAAAVRAEPLLAVSGVTVKFGGVTALQDVSLDVAPSEIRAVVGPNGAGKSTLFNVLSGIYRPVSGSVRYRERELTRLRPDQIAQLGIARTFQGLGLFPNLSVEDNLMLGRHHLTGAGFIASGLSLPPVRREDSRHRARVGAIAEFMEIERLLRLTARSLPYGEQKRVELARALAAEPSLLLLDEPVAGMSAEETRRMAATILDIREALEVTVIVVEHDMSLVMRISDRVTVLDFGRSIGDGTPDEVRANPTVVAAYLGDAEHFANPAVGENGA
jgi:branched-chain amino acid transport system ATP-binding protein